MDLSQGIVLTPGGNILTGLFYAFLADSGNTSYLNDYAKPGYSSHFGVHGTGNLWLLPAAWRTYKHINSAIDILVHRRYRILI